VALADVWGRIGLLGDAQVVQASVAANAPSSQRATISISG
jgi:hypothetical protein